MLVDCENECAPMELFFQQSLIEHVENFCLFLLFFPTLVVTGPQRNELVFSIEFCPELFLALYWILSLFLCFGKRIHSYDLQPKMIIASAAAWVI